MGAQQGVGLVRRPPSGRRVGRTGLQVVDTREEMVDMDAAGARRRVVGRDRTTRTGRCRPGPTGRRRSPRPTRRQGGSPPDRRRRVAPARRRPRTDQVRGRRPCAGGKRGKGAVSARRPVRR
ncbi:hypothetical protein [Ornithinimicrobium kibberense]|uniref:hypothetical protein n=1 Tax=Ornithinimicrobium kibberense TaxID=282060 RepID=UPI003612EC99